MLITVKEPAETLRVLLADEHRLFRDGLRGMLEAAGITVVGEARSDAEAARLARERAPDVLVLGRNRPGEPGGEAVRRILAARPGLPVVVLAASAGEEEVLDALSVGAAGYLLMDTPAQELTCAIRQAAGGSSVLAGEAMSTVRRQLRAGPGAAPLAGRDTFGLTARELEVLRLLASGADNAAIGRELSISPHTVKHHVTRILEKLQADSRVAAAVRAVRDGIV